MSLVCWLVLLDVRCPWFECWCWMWCSWVGDWWQCCWMSDVPGGLSGVVGCQMFMFCWLVLLDVRCPWFECWCWMWCSWLGDWWRCCWMSDVPGGLSGVVGCQMFLFCWLVLLDVRCPWFEWWCWMWCSWLGDWWRCCWMSDVPGGLSGVVGCQMFLFCWLVLLDVRCPWFEWWCWMWCSWLGDWWRCCWMSDVPGGLSGVVGCQMFLFCWLVLLDVRCPWFEWWCWMWCSWLGDWWRCCWMSDVPGGLSGVVGCQMFLFCWLVLLDVRCPWFEWWCWMWCSWLGDWWRCCWMSDVPGGLSGVVGCQMFLFCWLVLLDVRCPWFEWWCWMWCSWLGDWWRCCWMSDVPGVLTGVVGFQMFQVVQRHRALYVQASNCVEEKEW